MKKLSTYSKIVPIAAFLGLTVFAAHEKYLLFTLGFAVATWIVARNQSNEERLQCLADAARNDANTYCELWQLECKSRVMENPQQKPKKPTSHEFN
jgi:hypothetical protein